jgi:hypothetical protein
MNRIGAGRLQHIANILKIPVGNFFDLPQTRRSCASRGF